MKARNALTLAHGLACCLGLAAMLTVGCEMSPNDVVPTTLTITFDNQTSEGVEITFYSSDNADVEAEALVDPEMSEELMFTVSAGESFRFARACTDFQAAIVENARQLAAGGEVQTDAVRIDMDFACGQFVTFAIVQEDGEPFTLNYSATNDDPLPDESSDNANDNTAEADTAPVDQTAGSENPKRGPE